MRRQSGESGGVELSGEVAGSPPVVVEPCRCGCTPLRERPEAEWALAQAWAWLTRVPADAGDGADDSGDEPGDEPGDGAVDPARLPWWDARSRPARRRAVLPLVLLGELQAGVLLRAVWEVVQKGAGPSA